MSEDWAAFVKDPRSICRYGMKCYQKNPEHHKSYKHPPKAKRFIRPQNHDNKRFKPSPKDDEASDSVSSAENVLHPSENTETEKTLSDKITKTSNHADSHTTNKAHGGHGNEASDPSTSQTEVQLPEEPVEIKLPETITYHDKNSDPSIIKDLFLLDMPEDFFQFYKCLQQDSNFEKTLASVNLQLIGPFDLLLGKLPVLDDKELYLIHCRFFYDVPEFQAVLKRKGKSEYHIGYFRDDPNGAPVFMAVNDSAKDCHITPVAGNIFAAVYLYLDKEKTTSPFISIPCQRLMEKIKRWSEEYKYSLEPYDVKKRLVQSLTKTFHGAGIVVPYNKKTDVGYRQLAESDVKIKKLFKQLSAAQSQHDKDSILSQLQPVITFANIAVDECDFGTGLEAGIDLFCSGLRELQPSALSCLTSVYTLLNRDAFGKIIQAHLKYRRKGPNMSVLSASEK